VTRLGKPNKKRAKAAFPPAVETERCLGKGGKQNAPPRALFSKDGSLLRGYPSGRENSVGKPRYRKRREQEIQKRLIPRRRNKAQGEKRGNCNAVFSLRRRQPNEEIKSHVLLSIKEAKGG